MVEKINHKSRKFSLIELYSKNDNFKITPFLFYYFFFLLVLTTLKYFIEDNVFHVLSTMIYYF